MSNNQLSYCIACGKTTSFYHVDSETWECNECGHIIGNDEIGNSEADYPDADGLDSDEYDVGYDDDDIEYDDEYDDEYDEETFETDYDTEGTFDAEDDLELEQNITVEGNFDGLE